MCPIKCAKAIREEDLVFLVVRNLRGNRGFESREGNDFFIETDQSLEYLVEISNDLLVY
jgi:hypothetical protein